MKNVLIHCFSGTGNTAHAARAIAQRLEQEGFTTTYRAVRRDMTPPPGHEAARPDLHVFLFPVYALCVPHLMARYLRRLPAGHAAPTAVVCTTGRYSATVRDGYEGGALMQARALLARRGYVVFLTDAVDYPASITNAIPAPPLASQSVIMEDAERAVEEIADRVAHGETTLRPCGPWARAGSRLFGWLYAGAGRFMFGKLFVADASCDGCGLCARACPARALRMIGRLPFWRWRCEGCERCMNLCPRASIQLSVARLVLFSVPLVWNPLVTLANAVLPPHGAGLSVIVHLAAYVLATFLLDPVAAALERVPFLRRVMGFSWTRGFRRWLAPGFDPRR
jgi:ferredoxin